MPLFFDPLYLLFTGIGLGITLWAQYRVKSTFTQYSKVGVRAGLSGAEAAAVVCRAAGVPNVRIERHAGFLSDHYDPRGKVLRLSPDVYDGRSIASIAVAAHEAGHSIQDARAYPLLGFRSNIVPLANIGSQMWALPFIFGMLLGAAPLGRLLMLLGVVLFAGVVLFQLATLPVEFNASKRAKLVLAESGIVQSDDEARGVSKVLDAAALTYVAAALSGLLQLVYLVLRTQRRE